MNLYLFVIMSSVISVSYWLEERTRWAAHISGVLLLIVIASVFGNLNLVSSAEETYSILFKWAVPLGIILMLLAFNPLYLSASFVISTDRREWRDLVTHGAIRLLVTCIAICGIKVL